MYYDDHDDHASSPGFTPATEEPAPRKCPASWVQERRWIIDQIGIDNRCSGPPKDDHDTMNPSPAPYDDDSWWGSSSASPSAADSWWDSSPSPYSDDWSYGPAPAPAGPEVPILLYARKDATQSEATFVFELSVPYDATLEDFSMNVALTDLEYPNWKGIIPEGLNWVWAFKSPMDPDGFMPISELYPDLPYHGTAYVKAGETAIMIAQRALEYDGIMSPSEEQIEDYMMQRPMELVMTPNMEGEYFMQGSPQGSPYGYVQTVFQLYPYEDATVSGGDVLDLPYMVATWHTLNTIGVFLRGEHPQYFPAGNADFWFGTDNGTSLTTDAQRLENLGGSYSELTLPELISQSNVVEPTFLVQVYKEAFLFMVYPAEDHHHHHHASPSPYDNSYSPSPYDQDDYTYSPSAYYDMSSASPSSYNSNSNYQRKLKQQGGNKKKSRNYDMQGTTMNDKSPRSMKKKLGATKRKTSSAKRGTSMAGTSMANKKGLSKAGKGADIMPNNAWWKGSGKQANKSERKMRGMNDKKKANKDRRLYSKRDVKNAVMKETMKKSQYSDEDVQEAVRFAMMQLNKKDKKKVMAPMQRRMKTKGSL